MPMTRRDLLVATGTATAAIGMPGSLFAANSVPAKGELSNPKASPAAKALYRYLSSIYGQKTLTGQQESFWAPEGPRREIDFIERTTGKLPAILGLDYIDPSDWANTNDRATRWYREGGIPTLCWHWGAPDIGTGYENSKKDFDVPAAMKSGTAQNAAMARDLSAVADQLTILRDRGVPVLWRPFHEFTGNWFWWGKWGANGFKALWNLMHEYFTHSRGLDNLIWVLGYAGQSVDKAYYPGRATVDIAGADTYVSDHGNLAPMFREVRRIVGDSVPICLHENGPIPDPATLGPRADWLYFMTWHSEFILDGKQNRADELKAYFNSDRYLTRDELPDLKIA